MTNPQRYDITNDGTLEEADDGVVVSYDDYEHLRAERIACRDQLEVLLQLLDEAAPYVAQDDNGNYRKGRIDTVLLEKIKNALAARKGGA